MLRLSKGDKRAREGGDLPFKTVQLVLDVQTHVNRHLVVAATARVYLLAEVAQRLREAALHGHVDVLVRLLNREIARLRGRDDLRERGAHTGRLILRDDRGRDGHFREHRHVGRRAETVPSHKVHVQYRIVPDRVVEHVGIHVSRDCLFGLHLFFA